MTPTPALWRGLPALALATTCLTTTVLAQATPQDSPQGESTKTSPAGSGLLRLRAGTFDPVEGSPEIPAVLKSGNDIGLFVVQLATVPTEAQRTAIKETGAEIHGYLPDDAYVVRGNASMASRIQAQPGVRFVGAYEPAYRLDPQFVNEWLQNQPIGDRRYNFVVVDKRTDKPALARAIRGLGGEVVDMHEGSILFTAELSQQELFAAARLDQVLWIDLWSAPEEDMDNARVQGGGNYIETVGNYRGQGVRGHVYEGAQSNHPDFTPPLTNVASSGAAQSHGHCTAGIVFGNGSSSPAARGMAPEARGFYTDYNSTSGSRNSIVNQLVNTHQVMFTTASWGNSRTTSYTSVSADADDIIFDHRIPWTQSQSNSGNRQSRPQAWAKNIFSIGGVNHRNNSSAGDDSWAAGGASTGPATDGRIKPDLCAYYDQILTSDRTGSAGYTNGSTYSNFGGTSGATPIVAGHNALAIQMYTDGLFGSNTVRVPGGTPFQNRPLAQTLKALMIVGANQYSFTSSSSDNRREHQGWGFPNLRNLYDEQDDIFVVPEDRFLAQGSTDTFTITVDPNEPRLKICMTYVEPAGNPAASQTRVNDLNLRVTSPSGTVYFGNAGLRTGTVSTTGGSFDTVDPVECVFVNNPSAGDWTVEIIGTSVVFDTESSTPQTDASYALAVLGGTSNGGGTGPASCARNLPDDTPGTGTVSAEPFGEYQDGRLLTAPLSNASLPFGGAIYMDVVLTDRATINGFRMNTSGNLSTSGTFEVFMLPKGTSVFGNEDQRNSFVLRGRGEGFVLFPNFLVPMELDEPIVLEAGTYGMAIVSSNFSHQYNTGTGQQTIGSGPLQVVAGSASDIAFQGPIVTGATPSIEFVFADHSVNDDTNSNVRYQTILRQSELGDAGMITGLALAANWAGVHSSETLEVFMGNVPAGWTLLSNMTFNSLNSQNVLTRTAHDWFVRQDEWNSIGLERPFAYDGQGDVIVEIRVRGNVISHPMGGFRSATNRPRAVANSWDGSGLPAVANILDDNGLEMQVQFGCASTATFGNGCGGMLLEMESLPIIDQSFVVASRTRRQLTITVLHIGTDSTNGYPVRLDFNGFGWPDCVLWHDVTATVPSFSGVDGIARFNLVAPNVPDISLVPLYVQALQLNPNLPNGVTASNYGRLVVGEAQ